MKKILVLGTGSAQKDIIEACKERDYFVIATSNVAGYQAQKAADAFYQADITDVDATEKVAKDLNVDFVYSIGSDVAMPTIAKTSEDLGLACFVPYDTAVICNHKNMLRRTLKEKNIDGNIPFQILESANEEIRIPFPAIMKPSDSQGQRGVCKVYTTDEVKEHFAETVGFSREKRVIIEPFIDGDEISVNVFLQNGELKFYLISDRKVWDEYPGGIIHEHVIPSKYEKDTQTAERIKGLVSATLDAIGLKDGPAYFQIMIDACGKPYLIEVTPRLDGCHMWRAVKFATGVDLLAATIDMLEGKPYAQPEAYACMPYSLEFLCGKPGTVFNSGNYDIPEHVYLCWYYQEGQKINRMNGYYEKCGYVIKRGTAK